MNLIVHQYFKHSWLAGIALLTFFSLQLNDNLLEDSTIISKTLYFAAGTIILLLTVFLLLIRRKDFLVNLTAIDLILSVWALYILIRVYFAEQPCNSPRLVDFIALCAYFILLRSAPPNVFSILFYTISCVGIVQAFYGIFQLYNLVPANGQFKLTGSFFNLGAYSSFLAISFCISVGLVLFSGQFSQKDPKNQEYDHRKKRMLLLHLIPILNIVMSTIILPVSLNRTAWITVTLVSLFLYSYQLKRLSFTIKILIGVTAVVLFAGVIWFKKDSASGRMLVWKVTTNIIKHNPVLGVGYDRFQAAYMDQQAAWLAEAGSENEKMLADNVYYAFNDLLQLTAELGIPGLMILFLLIVVLFRVNEKGNPYTYITKGVVLGYLIISLFYYPHYILALKVPLVISLAWLSGVSATQPLFSFRIRPGRTLYMITLAGLLFCCGACLTYLWRLRGSYKEWRQAQSAYQSEAYSRSLHHFNRALPLLRHNGMFLSQFGKMYLLSDSLDKATYYLTESKRHINNTVTEIALGDVNKRSGRYSLAELHYQTALNMVPNKFYTEYLLMELYGASGQQAKVCQKSTEILNKKVKVFSTAVRQIVDAARVAHSKNNCSQ